MRKHFDVWAETHDFGRDVHILIGQHRRDGSFEYERMMPVTIGKEPGEMPRGTSREPTMLLTSEEAQRLMDALWSCGLRPTEGSGSAGCLAATQAHLADMQKITQQLLDHKLAPTTIYAGDRPHGS